MRLLTSSFFLCMTTSSVTVVDAYDFIITSKGGFYEAITDVNGTQIGERFQNPAINQAGDQIGTSQGFGYSFAPNSTSDPANKNRIFFLDDGQIELMDEAIVVATGSYEKYTGGRISENIASFVPDYTLEITLLEPEEVGSITTTADQTQQVYETFKITAEGGFALPFMSPSGEQFGEMFQNPIFVKNNKTGDWEKLKDGSTCQGFGFNFVPEVWLPNDTLVYFTEISPYIGSSFVRNRLFFLPGGELTVCNEAIVQGTGVYKRYTGGSFRENVTHLHPKYVAEITLQEKEPYDSHLENPPGVILFFNPNSTEAMEKPILNGSGAMIGLRLQHPIENQDGARVGTMLAYAFVFPNPAGQTRNGNRQLFMKDGGMTIFNDHIVHATGIYAGYAGGRAPSSLNKMTLIPPRRRRTADEERHSAGERVLKTPGNVPVIVILVVALASLIWI